VSDDARVWRRGIPIACGMSASADTDRSRGACARLNPDVNRGDWLVTHGTRDELIPAVKTRSAMKTLQDGGFRIDYENTRRPTPSIRTRAARYSKLDIRPSVIRRSGTGVRIHARIPTRPGIRSHYYPVPGFIRPSITDDELENGFVPHHSRFSLRSSDSRPEISTAPTAHRGIGAPRTD